LKSSATAEIQLTRQRSKRPSPILRGRELSDNFDIEIASELERHSRDYSVLGPWAGHESHTKSARYGCPDSEGCVPLENTHFYPQGFISIILRKFRIAFFLKSRPRACFQDPRLIVGAKSEMFFLDLCKEEGS
jgi:hypothetical protein